MTDLKEKHKIIFFDQAFHVKVDLILFFVPSPWLSPPSRPSCPSSHEKINKYNHSRQAPSTQDNLTPFHTTARKSIPFSSFSPSLHPSSLSFCSVTPNICHSVSLSLTSYSKPSAYPVDPLEVLRQQGRSSRQHCAQLLKASVWQAVR